IPLSNDNQNENEIQKYLNDIELLKQHCLSSNTDSNCIKLENSLRNAKSMCDQKEEKTVLCKTIIEDYCQLSVNNCNDTISTTTTIIQNEYSIQHDKVLNINATLITTPLSTTTLITTTPLSTTFSTTTIQFIDQNYLPVDPDPNNLQWDVIPSNYRQLRKKGLFCFHHAQLNKCKELLYAIKGQQKKCQKENRRYNNDCVLFRQKLCDAFPDIPTCINV
ncbi:unnamed protein product, partial [Didymodactylos carnosus]